MAEIMSLRPYSKKYHGQKCTVVRAVHDEDEAFDPAVAKTVVELEDGRQIVLLNDEVKG